MKLFRFAIAAAVLISPAGFGQATSSDAAIQKFTPGNSAYARRIVNEQFTLVDDLKKVDPDVRAAFHAKVQPEYIANHGERFNATDVVTEDLPARRFILAGSSGGLWFIWYEHGGIAYHHDLVVFSKNGHWQIVAVVQGNVKGELNFESLKQAIKAGQFSSQPGLSQF